MSDILFKWLNIETKLSKKITDIEQEFSNGYLFAELLVKYQQLPSLDKFKNGDSHDEKNHNFTLLDKKFKDYNIRLKPEEFSGLMAGQKNLAKKVLFRIKMWLSKKETNLENLALRDSNEIQDLYKKMMYPKISAKAQVTNRQMSSISKKKKKETESDLLIKENEYYLNKMSDIKKVNKIVNMISNPLSKNIFI